MSDLLPFLVLGLASGSVYGLAGAGLVVTYTTSGIFNFAHGAVAAAAAYAFYELWHERGMPWPLAALICLGVLAPLAGVALELLAKGLAPATPSMKIVGTVGLLLGIQGFLTSTYGPEARYFPPFLPSGSVDVLGARVGIDQLIVAAIAVTGSAGLAVFFRVARLGVAMRAVVDDPALLDLSGTSPDRVRRLAWIIGAGFASLSGILLAPSIGLDAILLTFLVVQAFGAAAVGSFRSLPMTFAGGLLIGVLAALATRYAGGAAWWAGVPASLPFLVLFTVLLVARRGRFVDAASRLRRAPTTGSHGAELHIPPSARRVGAVAAAGCVVAVPALVGARLPVFSNAAIFIVVFLSMVLLINLSGQVSLCHAAFAAVGATTFSHLAHGAGLPWLIAFLGAGVAAMALGAVVAIPAIRLSGLYLALATFGLGVLLERLVFGAAVMFGSTGTRTTPRPGVLGLDSDVGFYYLIVTIVVVAAVLTRALATGRLGRLLTALADAPVALATLGATVTVTRVLVFCMSAFLAGTAGALFGGLNGSASVVGFGPVQSLVWLAVLAAGGRGLVKPALVGGLAIAVLPSYLRSLADYQAVLFGAVAVFAALSANGRLRMGERIAAASKRSAWRLERSPVRARMAAAQSR